MLTNIEKQLLIDSAISSYEKYPLNDKNWIKAIYYTNIAGSTGLFYYQDGDLDPQPLKTQINSSGIGFDNYKDVLKIISDYRITCQQSETTRWNKGTITIYPSGKYESEFIWDNETYLESLKTIRVNYFLLHLGSDFLYRETNKHRSTWQTATYKTIIKNDILLIEMVSLDNENVLIDVTVPSDIQEYYVDMHDFTINGEVKSLFKPWNGIIFQLSKTIHFSVDRDCTFIFEENP